MNPRFKSGSYIFNTETKIEVATFVSSKQVFKVLQLFVETISIQDLQDLSWVHQFGLVPELGLVLKTTIVTVKKTCWFR